MTKLPSKKFTMLSKYFVILIIIAFTTLIILVLIGPKLLYSFNKIATVLEHPESVFRPIDWKNTPIPNNYMQITAANADNLQLIARWGNAKEDDTNAAEEYFRIESIAFSPDGTILATGKVAGPIQIWRLSDGALITTFTTEESPYMDYYDIEFSPNGQLLASASDNGLIRLWKVADGSLVREIDLDITVYSLSFSQDGDKIAIAYDNNGFPFLWNVIDGKIVKDIPGYWGTATYLEEVIFSHNGNFLALMEEDRYHRDIIKIFDTRNHTWRESLEIPQDATSISDISFSSDGNILAALSDTSNIYVFDTSNGKLVSMFGGQTSEIFSISLSQNSEVLVSVSRDRSIRIWKVSDGTLLRLIDLPGYNFLGEETEISSDGKLIAVVMDDGSIYFLGLIT
jgi:WD40 repeat protein